jgi:hypothetical protein
MNMKIKFVVLGTFFYRKKVPNLQKSSCTKFKTLGLCPKPYHLLKNKALLPLAKASLRLADQFVGA